MRAAGEKQRSGTSLQRMADGIIGAFLVRIPVSIFMSRLEPVSLFLVGLATPCSTVVQILLFLGYYAFTAGNAIDKCALSC